MAVTSGSISTALVNINYSGATVYRNLVFSWTRTSASGTTSRISWELRGGGTVTASDEKYCTLSGTYVNIDGTRKYTQSGSMNLSYNTLVASGTCDFTHSSATSEKSFTVAIGGNVYSSSTSTQSGTWTLPAISTLTAAGMTVGNNSLIVGGSSTRNPGFTFTNVNNSLWYGLYWFPVNNGVIASQGTLISSGLVQGSGLQTTANNWSINDKSASFTSPSPQVAFKLYTYKANDPSGSNIVGYTDFTYKDVTYHDNLKPSFGSNFSIIDSSGYYNSNSNLLKTISSGTGTSSTISFDTNATLSSYFAKVNGNNVTSSLVNNNTQIRCSYGKNDYSGNTITFTFSVTDSRGLTQSTTSSYTWDNYSNPTLTLTASRNASDPTTIVVSGTISTFKSSSPYRTLTLTENNGSTTTTITSGATSSSSFSFTRTGRTASTTYTYTASLGDSFKTVSAQAIVNAEYDFLIDVKADGTGIGIRRAAESNQLIIGNMSGGINLYNNLDVKQGNYYLNGTAFGDSITRNTYTRTARGTLSWSNQTDGDSYVIAKSALAFWNGAFSGTGSNLMYCAAQDSGTTGSRIIGLDLSKTYGGPAADYVIIQGTTTSADAMTGAGQRTGTWQYRKWNSGFLEVWFNGSIYLPAAGTASNGFLRTTTNVNIPSAIKNAIGTFADTAVVSITGAYSYRFYTSGGIKTDGTQFEAQILGANSGSIAAASWSGWNVYISGPAR